MRALRELDFGGPSGEALEALWGQFERMVRHVHETAEPGTLSLLYPMLAAHFADGSWVEANGK